MPNKHSPCNGKPRRDYPGLFLLARIAITATPKPSRINKGYRMADGGFDFWAVGGFGRVANSNGILTCEPVPGWKRHCEYASRAAPSSCLFPVVCSIRAPETLPVC